MLSYGHHRCSVLVTSSSGQKEVVLGLVVINLTEK
jgi:hypothetical protein